MDQGYRDKLRDRERINSQKGYSTNSQRGTRVTSPEASSLAMENFRLLQ
jgi:hypothetical protein